MAPAKPSISVDVIERREEARRKREAAIAAGKYVEDKEVDWKKKPLNADHVRALADLISYFIFLGFIFCVVFMNPAEFNAQKVINGMTNLLDSSSVSDVSGMWTFIDGITPIVHETEYYSGRPIMNETTGEYVTYWFGRENLALGKIRLRQIRVEDKACYTAEAFKSKLGKYCYPAVVPGPIEDSSNYRGNGTFVSPYEARGDGYSWYSTTTKVMYPSGGYMEELPLTPTAASTRVAYLQESGWVDENSRAVFVEFSTYNANIDHFAVARIAFEILPSGLVVSSSNYDSVPLLSDLRIFTNDGASYKAIALLVLEFTLYGMVLAYLLRAADIASDAGSIRAYLKDPWNLLDILNVVCFLGLVITRATYMLRSAVLTYDVYGLSDDDGRQPQLIDDDNPDYDSYYRVRQTVEMWRVGRNLLAFGVFVNFARAFKYVRASPKLSVLTQTVAEAIPLMEDLIVIFFVIFLAFCFALRLLIGTAVDGYADFIDSCFSLLSIVLSDLSDVEEMTSESPGAFPIVFVLMIFCLVFVMLTLLLKAVDSAFMSVMEKQKYEKDNFVEELKEAAVLLARETYWSITAPVQLFLVQRRMKKRSIKRQQMGNAGANNNKNDIGGGKKEFEMTDLSRAEEGGSVGGPNSKAQSSQSHKSSEDVKKNEMERYSELKQKISAGKFVSEDEVKITDIVETSEYLQHRQGVLERRLSKLMVLLGELGLEPGDLFFEDEDIDGILDPSEHPSIGAKAGHDDVVSKRSKQVKTKKK